MRTQSSHLHTRRVQARFDRWSRIYDSGRISSWFQHYQKIALSRFDSFERLLDVGCGTGWAVGEAVRRLPSAIVCGIDMSGRMIRKAERSKGSERSRFCTASAEAIPFSDQSFDGVICTNSFHHYENPLVALGEIRRVMRPGGKLVLIDSARDVHPVIWMQDLLRIYFERGHVRYYTRSEFRGMIDEAGLRLQGEIRTFRGFLHCNKIFTGLILVEASRNQ